MFTGFKDRERKRWFILWSIAVILYALWSFCVLFAPPRMGAADNGDFYRLAERVGVCGYQNDELIYFDKVYEQWGWKPVDFAKLTAAEPSFSNIYPIMLIRGLTNLFGDTATNSFSTAYLAIFYYVVSVIAVGFCFYHFIVSYGVKSIFAFGVALPMFFGSMYLAYYNSFYGEAMIHVSLFCEIGFSLWAIRACKGSISGKIATVFSVVVGYMLITAKPQCVVGWPFLLIFLLALIIHHSNFSKKIFTILWYTIMTIVMIYISLTCIRFYRWNSELNEKDTLFSSIFYGALLIAEEPEQTLIDLGLDPELVVDRGRHAYDENRVLGRHSAEAEEMLHNRINTFGVLKYYLFHPDMLWKAMEQTTQEAIEPDIILHRMLREESTRTPDERLNIWRNIRKYVVPHHFWQYIVVYGSVLIALVYRFICNKDEKMRLKIVMLVSILLFGIAQFPLPFIGNGYADTTKQLYLFMLTYDILLFCLFSKALFWLANCFKKRLLYQTKNRKIHRSGI